MCGKWLKYVGNGLNMLEIPYICEIWLMYVGNNLDMSEMA